MFQQPLWRIPAFSQFVSPFRLSLQAIVGHPNCQVSVSDPGISPPPGSSLAPNGSGGGGGSFGFNLIGAIVGPILAVVAVAGMILGLMDRKRRRSHIDSSKDNSDERSRLPPLSSAAISGDAHGGNDNGSGGSNSNYVGLTDGHPEEIFETWNNRRAGGSPSGVASATIDEGVVRIVADANIPTQMALQMTSLGAAAVKSNARIQTGSPPTDNIQSKVATMLQLATDPSATSLFPGSDGSGLSSLGGVSLASLGGVSAAVGGTNELSTHRWSWASLQQRPEQSMVQHQLLTQDDSVAAEGEPCPSNVAAEGEAYPSSVSSVSPIPSRDDALLPPLVACCRVVTTVVNNSGPKTRPSDPGGAATTSKVLWTPVITGMLLSIISKGSPFNSYRLQ